MKNDSLKRSDYSLFAHYLNGSALNMALIPYLLDAVGVTASSARKILSSGIKKDSYIFELKFDSLEPKEQRAIIIGGEDWLNFTKGVSEINNDILFLDLGSVIENHLQDGEIKINFPLLFKKIYDQIKKQEFEDPRIDPLHIALPIFSFIMSGFNECEIIGGISVQNLSNGYLDYSSRNSLPLRNLTLPWNCVCVFPIDLLHPDRILQSQICSTEDTTSLSSADFKKGVHQLEKAYVLYHEIGHKYAGRMYSQKKSDFDRTAFDRFREVWAEGYSILNIIENFGADGIRWLKIKEAQRILNSFRTLVRQFYLHGKDYWMMAMRNIDLEEHFLIDLAMRDFRQNCVSKRRCGTLTDEKDHLIKRLTKIAYNFSEEFGRGKTGEQFAPIAAVGSRYIETFGLQQSPLPAVHFLNWWKVNKKREFSPYSPAGIFANRLIWALELLYLKPTRSTLSPEQRFEDGMLEAMRVSRRPNLALEVEEYLLSEDKALKATSPEMGIGLAISKKKTIVKKIRKKYENGKLNGYFPGEDLVECKAADFSIIPIKKWDQLLIEIIRKDLGRFNTNSAWQKSPILVSLCA